MLTVLKRKAPSSLFIKISQNISNLSKSKFEEAQFIKRFLDISQNKRNFSKQEIDDCLFQMKENIGAITRPNSIAVILHKMQNFKENLNDDLQEKILNQSSYIFKTNYDFSDQGDLIRAGILVSCLQKVNNPNFYREMAKIVSGNLEKFSFINLMTIIESYSYNKLFFKHFDASTTEKLLNSLNSKLNIKQLLLIPKYNNLLYYIAKNNRYELSKPDSEKFMTQIESLIKNVYNTILQIIIGARQSKSTDLFSLTDAYLSISSFNSIFPRYNDQYLLLGKQYNSLISEYFPDPNKMILVKFDFSMMIAFLKRYHTNPPPELNPRLCEYINKIFWANCQSKEFYSLEVYCYFLSFLLKSKKLEIDSSKNLGMFDLIVGEKNLNFLAKSLEVYLICSKTNQNIFSKNDYHALEKVIFENIDKLSKDFVTSPALIQIFQFMVALDAGDNEKWKKLFGIFANPNQLKRLDYLELIIRLVPAGGIKTKNLFKSFSNISSSLSRHDLGKSKVDPDLTSAIQQFWKSLESIIIEKSDQIYFDKIPIILFYFTYANIGEFGFKNVYIKFKKNILENIDRFSFSELSDIAYSYSRVQIEAIDIFYAISSRVQKMDIATSPNIQKMGNLYWAFANARLQDESLALKLEEAIFKNLNKLDLETFSEFTQALAINSQSLSKDQKHMLSNYAHSFLNDPKKVEAVNIQLVLGLLNAFNILDIFDDLKFWDTSLSLIGSRSALFNESPLLIYYVYLLYIHLSLFGGGINTSQIFLVVQQNYQKIIEYIKYSKKQSKSPFEEEVNKIISQNYKNLNDSDEAKQNLLMVHKNNLHQYYLVKKMATLDFKDKNLIPNLGTKDMILPYSIDILLGESAIEVNGPNHYLRDYDGNLKENGYNRLKRRLIERVGLKYVEIPYATYEKAPDRVKFVLECIKNHA